MLAFIASLQLPSPSQTGGRKCWTLNQNHEFVIVQRILTFTRILYNHTLRRRWWWRRSRFDRVHLSRQVPEIKITAAEQSENILIKILTLHKCVVFLHRCFGFGTFSSSSSLLTSSCSLPPSVKLHQRQSTTSAVPVSLLNSDSLPVIGAVTIPPSK